jgi:hypothetical protein
MRIKKITTNEDIKHQRLRGAEGFGHEFVTVQVGSLVFDAMVINDVAEIGTPDLLTPADWNIMVKAENEMICKAIEEACNYELAKLEDDDQVLYDDDDDY